MSRKNGHQKAAQPVAEIVTGCHDTGEDRHVGRDEAARIIERSKSTLRRLEHTELPPVIENGVHLHSVQRLLAYKMEHLTVASSAGGFDGSVAAAAFEQFDRGIGPVDVVKVLRLDPRLVRELQREWADLRGSFVVAATTAVKIERYAMTAGEDDGVRSGDDLLRILCELDRTECASCSRRTPVFCMRCYAHRPRRAEELTATAVAAARARAAKRAEESAEEEAIEQARSETKRQRLPQV